jgi:epsin
LGVQIYGRGLTRLPLIRSMIADIVYILDKRLNDSGRNWRHVYKTLAVVEYCVCCGSETFLSYAHDRLQAIRTLREFHAHDGYGRDRGACGT